jgi:hypothetical protein
MIKKLGIFINNIVRSLDNIQANGYSARKLTALFSMFMAAFIAVQKLPSDAQLHALYSFELLALLCLGIVTIEQIIKFKTGNGNTDTEQPK